MDRIRDIRFKFFQRIEHGTSELQQVEVFVGGTREQDIQEVTKVSRSNPLGELAIVRWEWSLQRKEDVSPIHNVLLVGGARDCEHARNRLVRSLPPTPAATR